jgi:phosphoglycolate phosphatase-like HAD superfamily hydrolase
MLDPDILTVMLRRAGLSHGRIREHLPDIQRAAERWYLRMCPPLHTKHCPGAAAVLDRLTRRGMLLGLVTGNLERIGWRKLDRAGLRHFFRYGAFAEMARRNGWIERRAPVSLIGDAPQDIIAARENGIRSISVRTGITDLADLEAERPDILLRNLRGLRLRMLE